MHVPLVGYRRSEQGLDYRRSTYIERQNTVAQSRPFVFRTGSYRTLDQQSCRYPAHRGP